MRANSQLNALVYATWFDLGNTGLTGCGDAILLEAQFAQIRQAEGVRLDQGRHAARDGADFLALVQFHHFLALAHFVLGKAFLNAFHFRLYRLHARHRMIGFQRQRQCREFQKDREYQDRQPHAADRAFQRRQKIKEGPRQEIVPAEVDRAIKVRDIELLAIVIEKADALGSTERLIALVEQAPEGQMFAVGTEIHLVNRMARRFATEGKRVITLDDTGCLCTTMYRITPQHLAWALENLVEGRVVNRIQVRASVKRWAKVALDRMLEVG